jgi:hypothetical protein
MRNCASELKAGTIVFSELSFFKYGSAIPRRDAPEKSKHGPIKSLGMDEGMTMVFRVKDPGMLKQVAVGDKVRFEAENADTGITVTKIQKMK